MKICLVGSSGVPIPSQYGGAVERHIYDLARFLAKRNHEVHVFTMKTKTTAKHEVIENVHIHRGGFFEEDPSVTKTLWKHAAFFWYILVNLSRLETDLIHAHNGIPGLAALLASRVRGIPFIFTNHTPYTSIHHKIASESAILKGKFRDFQVILEKFCAKNASNVIATSREVKEGLLYIGISEKKIFVVPNGVDAQKFQEDSVNAIRVRKKFRLEGDAIVLYIGRIVKYKGLDYLADSAHQIIRKHPNVKFVVVGPVSYYSTNALTPYYQELRKKIESRQLSKYFVFTGAVDEKDLIGLYSACDMLTLPSLSEGFGMVLVEAMSCGKPVIGSRIGGVVDVINDGEDGYLVSPAQPQEIASKINYLLERPSEMKDMGTTARRHVKEMFEWNILIPRIMEIYLSAIRKRRIRDKPR